MLQPPLRLPHQYFRLVAKAVPQVTAKIRLTGSIADTSQQGGQMRFVLLTAAAVILIRDPTGKWAGNPLQPWFETLRNKAGLYCCLKADGHPLDESQWDIKDNNYRVSLRKSWPRTR
jgi:hypothetical protein